MEKELLEGVAVLKLSLGPRALHVGQPQRDVLIDLQEQVLQERTTNISSTLPGMEPQLP